MGFRPQLAWATLSVNRRGAREHEQHGEFAKLAAIGGEWYAFAPEDADAAWVRLYALTRPTRVADA
jgi:hypothetical protein